VTAPTGTRRQPTPPIDPRIRERRVAVTRDAGRRRLRVLIGVLAVLLAFGAAFGLLHSPLASASTIHVVGSRQTSDVDVVRAAGLDTHPLMIDVDTGAVAHRVRRLPWVRTATAQRRWPNTVRIEIVERVPVAQMAADGGGWAVTDEHGQVIEVGGRLPELPVITGLAPAGPPGSHVEDRAADAITVARAVPPDLRPKVHDVGLDGDKVVLHLVPTGVVVFGDLTRLDQKLVAVETVLAKVDLRNLKVLDVRVPDAPVLTRS
jgi:cell division protein FtsQ